MIRGRETVLGDENKFLIFGKLSYEIRRFSF